MITRATDGADRLDRGEEAAAQVRLNARPASEQYIAHSNNCTDTKGLQNRPSCSTDRPCFSERHAMHDSLSLRPRHSLKLP